MFDVESYHEFLQRLLAATYDDCWLFEIKRDSTKEDQYRAERLSQVLDILVSCDSLFNECYKPNATISDFNVYWDYLIGLKREANIGSPEHYILESLLYPILESTDI